jgi:hypothetical protein
VGASQVKAGKRKQERTDKQTEEMTKVIGAFHDYANVPKN